MSNKKYRIKKYIEEGTKEVWFEIERYKKFLWFEWWSTEYEITPHNTSWPLFYRREDEAREKLNQLRNT